MVPLSYMTADHSPFVSHTMEGSHTFVVKRSLAGSHTQDVGHTMEGTNASYVYTCSHLHPMLSCYFQFNW